MAKKPDAPKSGEQPKPGTPGEPPTAETLAIEVIRNSGLRATVSAILATATTLACAGWVAAWYFASHEMTNLRAETEVKLKNAAVEAEAAKNAAAAQRDAVLQELASVKNEAAAQRTAFLQDLQSLRNATSPDLYSGDIVRARKFQELVVDILIPSLETSSALRGAIERAMIAPVASTVRVELAEQLGAVHVGTVMAWPFDFNTVPSGWLLCDGRAYGAQQHPLLFNHMQKLGFPYGQDGNPQNFKVPDYRGYFLRGLDDPDGPEGLPSAGRDVLEDRAPPRRVIDVELDMLASHSHDNTAHHHTYNRAFSGNRGVARGNDEPLIAESRQDTSDESITILGPSQTPPGVTVGRENRPKNVAVNWIMYCGD